ncbi:unnamed protein product [Didymodactylos carnosus]|uniref:Extradiol ring-cleavage dioxygenase class III enzyme subunit B domain-containing protein n=1 Tax=Didymodactylos carnosus TaxID=1234261 RepID=A0A815NUT3_9BILA|nr:unnamed protein product [Didymodactylos carnosus]CAF1437176.1 unnamed protein product [Didymodactylos carnosus]CAF4196400.1 unnamed protein product [Didymodactylos carnosus]CAF4314557.1 unnamed protein product [Didymodactylos carnosus]
MSIQNAEYNPTFATLSKKLPTVYLSHGGGPVFHMEEYEMPMLKDITKHTKTVDWYRQLSKQLGLDKPETKPSAIVLISAHWESNQAVRITSRADYPDLLYDYGGFPAHTYELKYHVAGSPQLSKQIQSLLTTAGIPCRLDTERNFDHGVFVPMKLIYPDADIPIVQISLLVGLSPSMHLAIGKALAPLRQQNVLIIGSGSTTHGFNNVNRQKAREFVDTLTSLLTQLSYEEREKSLLEWDKVLPYAKRFHAREEHLIPLHVVVGAASDGKGTMLYDYLGGTDGTLALTSYKFG